jgi:hypothetical protein
MAGIVGSKKEIDKAIFKIYPAVIECEGVETSKIKEILKIKPKKLHVLIQFSQIARVWRGDISPSKWFIVLAAILIGAGFYTLPTSLIILGLIYLAVGSYLVYYFFKRKKYVMLIELSSSGLYTFISPNQEYINKGYEILKENINQREENRKRTVYNITNGKYNFVESSFVRTAVGDQAEAVSSDG